MEIIRWTDGVENKEASYRVKEDRNILGTTKKKEGQLDWSYLA
jgi:hypothetical protein